MHICSHLMELFQISGFFYIYKKKTIELVYYRNIGYEISDSSIIYSPFPNHRMQQYCGLSLLMCASPIDIHNVDSLLFWGIPEQVLNTITNYTATVFP